VPGLIDALSACPDFYLRHQLALELLEAPQSTSLSPSLHALVRATVVALDHCHYFQPTVAEQLQRMANRTIEPASLRESPGSHSDDAQTLAVLEFVQKMHKNPFKITPADAEAFRAAGLDDAAYVDVFNTVAIQQSLDRLANYSGVRADNQPLLSQDNQAA
jgi:alkylhydroperoxidase family enzyme